MQEHDIGRARFTGQHPVPIVQWQAAAGPATSVIDDLRGAASRDQSSERFLAARYIEKLGNLVMSYRSRVSLLLVFGILSSLPISARLACAQSTGGNNRWAVIDVTSAINRVIEENKDGVELRERVVRRLSECSLIYGGLSTLASNAEAKKNYVQSQVATMEVESTLANPLQSEKRLEIEEAARTSVAMMLRGIKAQGDKEVGPLLRNCKALNDLKEIKNALRELSPQ